MTRIYQVILISKSPRFMALMWMCCRHCRIIKMRMIRQKKFDMTYRAILEGNAQRFNNNEENELQMDAATDNDLDEDDNDIYGEYNVKSLHMEEDDNEYLELSDTTQ
eukprot:163351_1